MIPSLSQCLCSLSSEPLLCFPFLMNKPVCEALFFWMAGRSRSSQLVPDLKNSLPKSTKDVFSKPGIQIDQYLTYMYMYVIILMYLEYIIFKSSISVAYLSPSGDLVAVFLWYPCFLPSG